MRMLLGQILVVLLCCSNCCYAAQASTEILESVDFSNIEQQTNGLFSSNQMTAGATDNTSTKTVKTAEPVKSIKAIKTKSTKHHKKHRRHKKHSKHIKHGQSNHQPSHNKIKHHVVMPTNAKTKHHSKGNIPATTKKRPRIKSQITANIDTNKNTADATNTVPSTSADASPAAATSSSAEQLASTIMPPQVDLDSSIPLIANAAAEKKSTSTSTSPIKTEKPSATPRNTSPAIVDIDHLPTEIIKPKVRVIHDSGAKYRVNLKYLKQHLEDVLFTDGEESYRDLPFISRFVEQQLMASPGIKAQVKGLEDNKYTDYMFIKKSKMFTHPLTGENLGMEYEILGSGKLADNDKIDILEITNVRSPIQKGEKLIPRVDLSLPETMEGKTAYGNYVGYILANTDGLWHMGQMSSVIISVGKREGINFGDVLTVYRPEIDNMLHSIDGKNDDARAKHSALSSALDKPLNKQGEVMVYKVFDKISLAVVINATGPLTINDFVKPESL